MPQVSLGSDAELRKVAAQLRKAERLDLTRELRKGQRQALRPLQPAIKAEALASLPKRGGYNQVMARAIKVTVLTRLSGGPVVRAHIYARGKVEHRDVAAVNVGRLRHPLLGRRRHWFNTNVLPGFVDRAVDRVRSQIVDESLNAIEHVLASVARS